MSTFDKAIGRIRVEVSDNGLKMHDYAHGAYIHYRAGWNNSCPMEKITLSVDEMRDLRYLLDRAIEAAMA